MAKKQSMTEPKIKKSTSLRKVVDVLQDVFHSKKKSKPDDDSPKRSKKTKLSKSGRHHSSSGDNSNYDSSNPASDDEFHLTIPSILTQSDGGLARMDQKLLGECMEPVVKSLRALDAESLLGLERVKNGARLCDGVNVRPIHDEVYPRYESFGTMSCVRYIHITEVPEQYSIGIFVFPPFSRIPLHDHPEMCVLSRLLYGDLQCLSLDLPNDEDTSPSRTTQAGQPSGQQASSTSSSSQTSSVLRRMFGGGGSSSSSNNQNTNGGSGSTPRPPDLPEGARRAFKNSIKHLHAPDVTLLFPYKGNLHEFYAGPNGAAVLDILLPPYDVEHERDCTFYDIHEDPTAAAATALAAAAQSTSSPPTPTRQLLADVGVLDPSLSSSSAANAVGVETSTSHQVGARDVRQEREEPPEEEQERIPCWIVPTHQPHDFHCLSGKYQKLGTSVIALQDS